MEVIKPDEYERDLLPRSELKMLKSERRKRKQCENLSHEIIIFFQEFSFSTQNAMNF